MDVGRLDPDDFRALGVVAAGCAFSCESIHRLCELIDIAGERIKGVADSFRKFVVAFVVRVGENLEQLAVPPRATHVFGAGSARWN